MGRPPKITDKKLKEAVKSRESIIITTSEVAEACDIDRRTANTRLNDHGELVSENHGRTKAWFLKENDPYLREDSITAGQLPIGSIPAVVITASIYGLISYLFLGVAGQLAALIMGLFFVAYAGSYLLAAELENRYPELGTPIAEFVGGVQ